MAGDWEVRGLFGNEYAMESAIDELKKLDQVPKFNVLDRRNLQVVLPGADSSSRELVKNIIKIAHGFVEGDAPLGQYDAKKTAEKQKKLKDYEEKRKKEAMRKH